jgi:DNA polymerase-1
MAAIMLDKQVPPAGEEETCDPEVYVTELERTECKSRTFLILYGGGAGKLASDLGISKRAAQVLIDEYFGTFRELKRYIDRAHAEVREALQVETIWGFIRRFVAPAEHWDSPDGWSVQRMAFNALIQNGAVVLTYLAMIQFDRECRKRKLKSLLIKQVHDSMVIDVHPDEVDEVAILAQQCMEHATKLAETYGVFGINVPLKSDVMIGDNWGQLEAWSPSNQGVA